jgi:hypothetical protein
MENAKKEEAENPKEDIEKGSKSSWVSNCIDNLIKRAKEKPFEFTVVCANLLFVIANIFIIGFNWKSNSRAKKLFVGQNKPLIDVTPISIIHSIADDKNKMCATLYSVSNYSGFVAKNISIDIAYGGNVYISEWLRAKEDSIRKKKEGLDPNLVPNYLYHTRPYINIKEIKPGKVKEYRGASGSLDLDKKVVGMGNKGYPLLIRVTWENDRGHVFDEIRKYKLLCTTYEIGHAFSFIQEGIVSHTKKLLEETP